MTLSMVFNLWTGPDFLSHEVNFEFFNGNFSVTTLGLNLLSGTYLNKLLFLLCPVGENNSI
jgi:hypothetical protein